MSGLYDCDFDGSWIYRERISISDGTVRCCESGILIPNGQPYAECQPVWSDEEDLESLSEEDRERWFANSSEPQCIEVWRLLRRNNHRFGACAPFGHAVELYLQAIDECWDKEDRGKRVLQYKNLTSTIKRARERYLAGGGPRLHPTEAASLQSGKWAEALPYSIKASKKVAA